MSSIEAARNTETAMSFAREAASTPATIARVGLETGYVTARYGKGGPAGNPASRPA